MFSFRYWVLVWDKFWSSHFDSRDNIIFKGSKSSYSKKDQTQWTYLRWGALSFPGKGDYLYTHGLQTRGPCPVHGHMWEVLCSSIFGTRRGHLYLRGSYYLCL